MKRRSHLELLLILTLTAGTATAQTTLCSPDFGDREFAFAGDEVRGPSPTCPIGTAMISRTFTVDPVPPSGPTNPLGFDWQSAIGDEGDYVLRVVYQCEGGPVLSEEFELSLITRLTLVGAEVTQGVARADAASGFNLMPGRKTLLRLFVDYLEDVPNTHTFTARLRAFNTFDPPNGDPVQCAGELADSPQRPAHTSGAHVAAQNGTARRRDLKSSLNFVLPPEWVQPDVHLLVESEDGLPLFSLFGGEDPAYYGKFLAVLQPPPPNPDGSSGANLDLTLVAVPWIDGGGAHVPGKAQMRDVLRRLRGALPFAGIDHRFVFGFPAADLSLPATPGAADVNALLTRALDRMELARALEFLLTARLTNFTVPPPYYGVLTDNPDVGGFLGLARIGGSGVGFDVARDPSVHAHEVGHILGLEHPGHSQYGRGVQCDTLCEVGEVAGPCCSCADASVFDFPNINEIQGRSVATLYDFAEGIGSREVWGTDLFPRGKGAPRPLDPRNHFELMSYCDSRYGAAGQWFSEWNWQIVTSGLDLLAEDIPPVTANVTNARVYAGTSDGVNVELVPVFEVDTHVQVGLDTAGEFTFRELDGSGTVLRTGLFDVEELVLEEGGQQQSYSFLIATPYDPAVRRAEFRQSGVLIDAIDASANTPTVQVLSPNGGEVLPAGDVTFSWTANDADGDDLLYWVQLSLDDGDTWQTLALGWPFTAFELNTDLLPGSTVARLRVTASDGFWNATDDSDDTFELPDDAPSLDLLEPPDGLRVGGEQSIRFEARADDRTDGVLRGGSIVWTSDLDGTIGTGETFALRALDLTLGDHTITVTATDSAGNPTMLQTTLHVEDFLLPDDPMVTPRADLAVELMKPTVSQRVGETSAYDVRVANWGRDAASGVALSVTFSSELSVVAAVPTTGSCTPTAGSVSCSFGTLSPQQEVTVQIDAAGQTASTATVSASVTSTTTEIDPSDNQTTQFADVRPAADPDMDGDGFTPAEGDCDDADPTVYPGAGERCNGDDDDCDGMNDDGGDLLCFVTSICSTGVCDPVDGCVLTPLNVDVDGDGFLAAACAGTDCDDADGGVWQTPITVQQLLLSGTSTTQLTWTDQGAAVGTDTDYRVLSGSLASLSTAAWDGTCLSTATLPTYDDVRVAPLPGQAYWYLVRAANGCGLGDPGSALRVLQLPVCP